MCIDEGYVPRFSKLWVCLQINTSVASAKETGTSLAYACLCLQHFPYLLTAWKSSSLLFLDHCQSVPALLLSFLWSPAPIPTVQMCDLLQKMLWCLSHLYCQNDFTWGRLLMFSGFFSLNNRRDKSVPGCPGEARKSIGLQVLALALPSECLWWVTSPSQQLPCP